MTVLAVSRRVLGIPVALLLALLLQVAVVNRAGLPGDATPDLVLIVVAATGALTGPVAGMFAGFFGGLALDVIPPAGHLAGEYALVFCLVGYGCGRLRAVADPMEEHVTVVSVTVTGGGAVLGEAAKVGLGLMLSDPEMTTPAVRHVLPGAILYDLIFTPFILWLVGALIHRTSARPDAASDPHQTPPRTAAEYGALRLSTAGGAPKLRLSGGPSAAIAAKGVAGGRAEPKLRLSGGTSPAIFRTPLGTSARTTAPGGRKPASVNFSGSSALLGSGALGPSLFQRGPANWIGRSGPGKGWLKSGSLAVPTPRLSSPGKGWLKPGKGAAGKSGALGGPGKSIMGKSSLGKSFLGKGPGKGWLSASVPKQRSVKRKTPDFKRSSAAFSVPAPRLKSPGRGWLNGSAAGRSRSVYRSSTVYRSSATPLRRRRGLRIGGRR